MKESACVQLMINEEPPFYIYLLKIKILVGLQALRKGLSQPPLQIDDPETKL